MIIAHSIKLFGLNSCTRLCMYKTFSYCWQTVQTVHSFSKFL